MPDALPLPALSLPLTIRDSGEALWIEDANGHRSCYCYYDDNKDRRAASGRRTRDEELATIRYVARALTSAIAPPAPPALEPRTSPG